eukprot:205834-Rhodomonas_salina.1
MDVELEAQMYSTHCDSLAGATWGSSPWGVIENLLEDSGFCSYRSWFEMRGLLDDGNCSTPT